MLLAIMVAFLLAAFMTGPVVAPAQTSNMGAPLSIVPNVSVAFGWANLAWGWSGGGKDRTEGQKIVEFDIDDSPAEMQAARAEGHLTVCYFSVGTLEPFRPDCKANKTAWQAVAVGEMTHWKEEWLDITKLQAVKSLMLPRFRRAAAQGCDAVEPDNIDCYDNDACWKEIRPPITQTEAKERQLVFNRWQTDTAHALGLVRKLHSHLLAAFDAVLPEG